MGLGNLLGPWAADTVGPRAQLVAVSSARNALSICLLGPPGQLLCLSPHTPNLIPSLSLLTLPPTFAFQVCNPPSRGTFIIPS